MKHLLLLVPLLMLLKIKASAQQEIAFNDIPNYVGKEVTVSVQVADFDSKTDKVYLYFGENYPRQPFTIIVNRMDGNKKIKLPLNTLLGRQIAYFTGTIVKYTGIPDSSANIGTEAIKKEAERDKNMLIGGIPMVAHLAWNARTTPVDLNGKLVMVITSQKQIWKKTSPAIVSVH